MDNIEELKSNLSIDINALHIEAQNQPVFCEQAGSLLAEAKAESKRKKLQYDEMCALVEMDIRNNPENYNMPKVTESAITSAVKIDERVNDARKDLIEAEKYSDEIDAIYQAYHQRKSMIQLEGQLYVSNYWGEVNVKDMDDVEINVARSTHDEIANIKRKR